MARFASPLPLCAALLLALSTNASAALSPTLDIDLAVGNGFISYPQTYAKWAEYNVGAHQFESTDTEVTIGNCGCLLATLGSIAQFYMGGSSVPYFPWIELYTLEASDLEVLLPLEPNLRFVKGAYLEPPEIAYTAKADVDAAYGRLVETALRGGAYAAIATHDEALIGRCLAFAERQGIPRDRFELQMLYGVRPRLQLDFVDRGYKVLVATPYGPEWYPYLMRRLAERPANLGFFVRNLVRR